MLGKTANGLFWMYRALERAENIARLIETGQRIALTRLGSSEDEWRSVLQTSGSLDAYETFYDEVNRDHAVDWLLRSKDNPGSVMSCISQARQNARMVRTGLTTEVWEATNAAYMVAKDSLARKVPDRDMPKVLRMLRQRAGMVRGATHGTMLRNDVYDFARIGTFLERADNTARIIDVKYYVLLPTVASVGSSIDNVQWEILLRSVSGRGGFRMAYGAQLEPRGIATFLTLDRRMPRSLAFCTSKILGNMNYLESDYGVRLQSTQMAEDLQQRFMRMSIDDVFDYGLHEYIQKVLGDIAAIGHQIEIDYRFYE
ncbi:putative alpha-E superfamily protein [Sagittula marina]|uniref:Putative alpha-E superfamily protein n=1 Tax=Sagittula marina TaxID=943940 RepID=A0A7W6GSM0_9RHOB|nr:alpha-E domain-containing protein [Sagittula marina]MBB3986135.1 putative alpha-E superfamily protein [Sagittula marina]